VAPGRVEPWSGEIKIAAAVVGRIGEVLVGVNDKVFTGEPLIRLEDGEARARIATAEAQIALRKRARNDQSTSSRAAERRRAEDWVADAERGVFDAQLTVDQVAVSKRAGRASDADLAAARTAMSCEQDRLKHCSARRCRAHQGPRPARAKGPRRNNRIERKESGGG
jgi:HlyD family secretion protein